MGLLDNLGKAAIGNVLGGSFESAGNGSVADDSKSARWIAGTGAVVSMTRAWVD